MVKQLMLAVGFIMLTLAIACKKGGSATTDLTEDYYLQAIIDGHPWRVTGIGSARFSAENIHQKNRFSINIHAAKPGFDTVANFISFDFDFVPKPGKYYFNNIESTQQDSGTIAIYNYYKGNSSSTKWSNSGYVNIESISLKEMKGTFSFTVKGDITDPKITTITEGAFKVAYGGIPGPGNWPGP